MDSKYDPIHETILCILHALLTGQYGLKGDALERLLRKWYLSEYAEIIEDTIEARLFNYSS